MTDKKVLQKIIATLEARKPPAMLFPDKPWSEELNKKIDILDTADIIRAALYVWNDDIHKAHRIAQQTEDTDGSYWHAILHRRERDFSNAKYWYARTGNHPVKKIMQLQYDGWRPESFVDQCEKSWDRKGQTALQTLENIQTSEIKALLEHVMKERP